METSDISSVKEIDAFSSLNTSEVIIGSNPDILDQNSFFFGKNLIQVSKSSYAKLFVEEVLHPFNIFQFFSIFIWIYEDYFLYAFTIFLLSAISIGITLRETYNNNEKLRLISLFKCTVKVLIDSKIIEMESDKLVPGNVIALDSFYDICPCDLVLVRGDAIVDESLLTGESTPVSKISYTLSTDSGKFFDISEVPPSSKIFCGTRILRARETLTKPALGLVLKIGFETEKGQLIHSILFQKPINFTFYSDSLKYICILGIVAFLGFIVSIYNQIRLNSTFYYIFSRALDLITVVVPPALPATMSIGTVFSLSRLKKKLIYCISPSKINVASKIDIFCFDKTGTLTDNGLELFEVLVANHNSSAAFSLDSKNISSIPSSLNSCMALCHSLQKIDNVLIGDPLDIKMFEASGWNLEENHNTLLRAVVRPPRTFSFDFSGLETESSHISHSHDCDEIGIIKCFDFCHEIRRTSVLSKKLSGRAVISYCKGSPESILNICDPKSIPCDFEPILLSFLKNGNRVIACATKNLGNLSWINTKEILRESVENNMTFLGFLVFENKIKIETTNVLSQLSFAGIRSVMVTGDNIFTSICVSRACGIIKGSERVFIPCSDFAHFVDYDSSDAKIMFQEIFLQPENIVFACNGDFLKTILSTYSSDLILVFLQRCRVFSRMSPEDKKLLVHLFQNFKITVGFCGDGANDCGALKSADIGISLSDSEASVAAPFSTSCKNISCVVTLLLEGRAALSTSFSCFKFMALYSMIQFTSLILLYSFGSSLGDNQFVYIDLVIILPLGMLMSRFAPSQRLVDQQPETKLISPSVLFSLFTQIIYQSLAQIYIFALIFLDPSHSIPENVPGNPNTFNPENAAIFLISSFLYIFSAMIFCSWRPFRSFYVPFYLYAGFSTIFSTQILFYPEFVFDKIFELHPLSLSTKKDILITAICFLIVSSVSELLKYDILAFFFRFQKGDNFTFRPKFHK